MNKDLLSLSKSILQLISGTAAGQLIFLLFVPIATRLYSPAAFGSFAVFVAILGVASIVSSLRYELAIPLPKKESEARTIVILALLINTIYSALLLILVIAFYKYLVVLMTLEEPFIIYFLPVAVFIIGLYKIFDYWAVRKKAFSVLSQTKFIQALANILIQLILSFFTKSSYGLILGHFSGQSAGLFSLIRIFKIPIKKYYLYIDKKKLKMLLKKHYRFFLYDSPAALMNVVSEYLPQFLLAILFNPSTGGFYILAHRILAAPSALIGQAVTQVIYGNYKKKNTLNKFVKYFILISIILFCFPLILLWCKGNVIFTIIFGDKWAIAGDFASWMIIGLMAQFLYSPLSIILVITNNQRFNLLLHLTILLLRLLGIMIGWRLNNAVFCIAAYSLIGFWGYMSGLYFILFKILNLGRKNNS